LTSPLAAAVAKKASITFTDASGTVSTGKSYAAYAAGDTTVGIMYPVGESNPQSVACYVNGLTTPTTNGCIDTSMNISIGSENYMCSSVTNVGKRTLKGFSTAAKKKMYDATLSSSDCPPTDTSRGYVFGCPYTSFTPYWNYYCASSTSSCNDVGDYANDIVLAAFGGTATSLTNGNGDFSSGSGANVNVRKQVIKKGTAYMSAWMYAIREFEDAIDDCAVGDVAANGASSGPVHAWDEGVAFYVGSLMEPKYLYGTDLPNIAGQGKLAYTLANKRCADFKTCGAHGGDTSGEAKVNHELSELFRRGQEEILVGNCAGVVPIKNDIVKKMTVPLIQGTLRYAYKCDKVATCTSDAVGEAYIFAAAVLPQLAACDSVKAKTVADMVKPSAFTCTSDSVCTSTTTNFMTIKAAFESCYSAMGVTCSDVGGLYSGGEYLNSAGRDASPCQDNLPPPAAPLAEATKEEVVPTWGVAMILILGALFVTVCCGFLYVIKMEKAGKPIFVSLSKTGAAA